MFRIELKLCPMSRDRWQFISIATNLSKQTKIEDNVICVAPCKCLKAMRSRRNSNPILFHRYRKEQCKARMLYDSTEQTAKLINDHNHIPHTHNSHYLLKDATHITRIVKGVQETSLLRDFTTKGVKPKTKYPEFYHHYMTNQEIDPKVKSEDEDTESD